MATLSLLLVIFAFAFWVLRIIATITTTLGMDFFIISYNVTIEIILLFVTLFSFLFIVKRKIFGALLYMVSYIAYFGNYIYSVISNKAITTIDYPNLLVSAVGIMISVLIFFDIGLNRNQEDISSHKKVDWFYKNKDLDRKYDERADRNQYKF